MKNDINISANVRYLEIIAMDDNDNTVEKKEHLKENKTKDVKVNKVKFSIYICLILVPFGLLASMVFLSMLEYSTWPILTETNIIPQNEANFPAMTFCPSRKAAFKENILKKSILFLTTSPDTQTVK